MRPSAEEIIDHLELIPLDGEGGWFRQSFVSEEVIPPGVIDDRYTEEKPLYTVIYYMVTDRPGEFSSLHKLKTDEIWHFYLGDPAELYMFQPGGDVSSVVLGQDLGSNQHLQVTVPRETWMACELKPGGQYALMGTVMAPGFTPSDFTPAVEKELISRYPEHAELIRRLIHPVDIGDDETGGGES